MKKLIVLSFVLALSLTVPATVINFDDLSLDAESYSNGPEGSDGFTSGSAHFNNALFDWSWGGFAYSNKTDTTIEELASQYNAITGVGVGDSVNYGIGYQDSYNNILPTIAFDTALTVDHLYVTNNNYAYYSMLNGNSFAKQFKSADSDWFMLTITGLDTTGNAVGSVDFYLADFRDGNSYIIDQWEKVELSSLGTVNSLEFSLTSSDVGNWGINTPVYFAIDNIVVPEPGSIMILGLGMLMYRKLKS